MKKKILFFGWLFCTFLTFGQQDNNVYDFFGGKLSVKKTVFYRLVFQINQNKVSGYSYMDEHGPKETKSVIQGTYNPKSKIIVFRESKKLTSRINDFYAEKCYLNGILKLEITNVDSKIEGTFVDKTPTGKLCNQGEIRLLSPDKYTYPKKQETKVVVKKQEIPKQEKVILPTFNSNKKTTLKTNEELTIFWNSDVLKLEIWDDEKEDNDKISIVLNDKDILKNYALKNKKKVVAINLDKKINTLKITALNSGLIGENTARIDFIDNKIIHQIVSELSVNKSVTINILKNN
ncbi:MAG TPA: hypothetical protein ENK67_01610 [Flavobacteriia bacterium]|nr:hypothetical protein [Flavobacteriia bacterium]